MHRVLHCRLGRILLYTCTVHSTGGSPIIFKMPNGEHLLNWNCENKKYTLLPSAVFHFVSHLNFISVRPTPLRWRMMSWLTDHCSQLPTTLCDVIMLIKSFVGNADFEIQPLYHGSVVRSLTWYKVLTLVQLSIHYCSLQYCNWLVGQV